MCQTPCFCAKALKEEKWAACSLSWIVLWKQAGWSISKRQGHTSGNLRTTNAQKVRNKTIAQHLLKTSADFQLWNFIILTSRPWSEVCVCHWVTVSTTRPVQTHLVLSTNGLKGYELPGHEEEKQEGRWESGSIQMLTGKMGRKVDKRPAFLP